MGDLNPFQHYGPVDPAGVLSGTGLAGGEAGSLGQLIADPLDLFGHRAEANRNEVSGIQLNAARQSIAAQQEMINRINQLYAPYRDAAQGGLQNYTNMVTGGTANITPSPQYQTEVARNTKAVNRAMAARGAYNSSGRGAALADILLQAGQNEASRQYGRQLDLQRLGTQAVGALGQAGQTAGSNVGSIYGNLGSNLNSIYQNYGLQRQQSLNQGAGALYGLGQYLMQQG